MEKMHAPSQFKRAFSQCVRIGKEGRVAVPAPIRKALGIRGKQVLPKSLDDGFINN